ncbi:BRO family protein [Pleionea sp. CnH1-48]|uniref:BRO family protein n=1 Tax=Pleionea sp. CnH1-48 TaxID=2954494 RepID=UPI002097A1C0|nr:BRO family protein [Pleionea sp. CnH1-48]MCO7227568.1 BRO family protein [Pleionea sp. CnH1-48]
MIATDVILNNKVVDVIEHKGKLLLQAYPLMTSFGFENIEEVILDFYYEYVFMKITVNDRETTQAYLYESDVYKLIAKAPKQSASKVKKWIENEVYQAIEEEKHLEKLDTLDKDGLAKLADDLFCENKELKDKLNKLTDAVEAHVSPYRKLKLNH